MYSSRVGPFVVAASLTLAACGGGGAAGNGNGSPDPFPPPPPPPPTDTCGVVPAPAASTAGPVEGAWIGLFPILFGIDGLFGRGLVQADGEAAFWIGSGYLWVGSVLATPEGDVRTTLHSYVRPAPGPIGGLARPGGTLALDEVVAKQTLTGKYQGALSDCQSLALSYSSRYESPASLETLAGVYTYTSEDPHTLTLTIHADGRMEGSDLLGCVLEGSVTVPDATRNFYDGSAVVTSCGEFDGHYEGILTLSDNEPNDNRFLHLALTNSDAAVFGLLTR